MSRFNDADDPRRRLLIQALAAGVFSAGLPGQSARADLLGNTPSQLPPGRSIYRLSGHVFVNKREANLNTVIGPNDTVETLDNSEIVFVVGASSYILRANSQLTLKEEQRESTITSALRLLSGRLLAVFGKGQRQLQTQTAVIGIRGTGVYLETDPEQTYFCTCYGVTDLSAAKDRNSRETIESKHHDKPRYILAKPSAGQLIRPAPFINHTDQELMLVETLVGRTPPFVFPGNNYSAPRREY
jgi:hypothetical protein